ncbi:MAG: chemotaxis response regulator protein-glutamate methylesterase [Calditrichae bacterium]|nr:chemotaxis response regulator protein-glutamate methylesterase [Calditrichia bacterium]
MENTKKRVLIVDDTALYRKIIKDVLESFDNFEVIGTAANGKIALSKIQYLKPDLITLDQEMPELNGLETLRELKNLGGNCAAVMVSSHTTKGANITMQALDLGAFDFIAKPEGFNLESNTEQLRSQFLPILKAFQIQNKSYIPKNKSVAVPAYESVSEIAVQEPVFDNQTFQKISPSLAPEVVAIGISTGGPKALAHVIPQLDSSLKVPVLIVQHMPPLFTKALADSLNNKSGLTVHEAENGQNLLPGHVYIAPGGKQMKVENSTKPGMKQIIINDDPPENFCKPSVDYLFRSVAKLYEKKALGVIMTGMGRDGVIGLRLMKRHGAGIMAQNKTSSTVFGMPMEAIKSGVVDYVADIEEIGPEINRICRGY